MKKIIKQEKDSGIVQITIADERWYVKEEKEGQFVFVPSVTWIASFYPKGLGFWKWLANKGWDEAEALKQAAGDKGSKVHQAICDLIDGKEVKMDSKYLNPTLEAEEELSLEEYEAIKSFIDWHREYKPIALMRETVVWNEKENYAGTIDFICEIEGVCWIIDFKTSQNIWTEQELQLSAYKHAFLEEATINDENLEIRLGILQLGYWRNKKKYKFTEIEDKFDLFLSSKKIWENETRGIEPLKKDYPEILTLKEGE
jgi:hypothetical protein